MKINFLEVGHTHKDIDALIGSPYIRFQGRCFFSALKNEEAKIRFVEEAMGITDYEKGLSDILFPLPGIMAVKEIRIIADHDGAPSTEYQQ